jgi:serine/threonine protein kinase
MGTFALSVHLTAKSDVWSFGMVLYEILTGRRSIEKNRPSNEQKLLEWVPCGGTHPRARSKAKSWTRGSKVGAP